MSVVIQLSGSMPNNTNTTATNATDVAVNRTNGTAGDVAHYSADDRWYLDLTESWAVVAIVFSCLAIVGNVTSICAVIRVRPHLTPHFKLILSLAVSDTLIGVSVLAHMIAQSLDPYNSLLIGVLPPDVRLRSCYLHMVIKAFNNTGLNITLLSLFAMAVDHYMAIVRPLHHPLLMTDFRANVMIPLLWLTALLTGFSNFIINIWKISDPELAFYNYCEIVDQSLFKEEFTVFALTLVGFFGMLVIYVKIYVQVQRRQADLSNRGHSGSLHRNKRALVTTLLILGTFTLCWLPICFFQIILTIIAHVNVDLVWGMNIVALSLMDRLFYDLVVFNAVCDPIIYVMRMREVQLGYRRFLYSCFKLKVRRNSGRSVSGSFRWVTKKPSSNITCESVEVMDRFLVNNVQSCRNGSCKSTTRQTSTRSKLLDP